MYECGVVAEIQTDLTMAEMLSKDNSRAILQQRVKAFTWSVDRIADNDVATKFYTGLPSFAVFMWLFKYVLLMC